MVLLKEVCESLGHDLLRLFQLNHKWGRHARSVTWRTDLTNIVVSFKSSWSTCSHWEQQCYKSFMAQLKMQTNTVTCFALLRCCYFTSHCFTAGFVFSYLCTWVKRDKVEWSFLSKETTRWQGLGLKPQTFRSKFLCTNHYTTVPPQAMHCVTQSLGTLLTAPSFFALVSCLHMV